MIIKTRAKINPVLNVLSKREDGYHDVELIYQSVSLCDTVELTVNNSCDFSFESTNKEIDARDNISLKAAALFFEKTGIRGGAVIKLTNMIPTRSGLGGGSADAAAVLSGLNRYFDNPVSRDELISIASKLGADVAFCLFGGTALGTGIGDKLGFAENNLDYYTVLVKEFEKPSTEAMYAELDKHNAVTYDAAGALDALKRADFNSFCSYCGNAFDICYPGLGGLKQIFKGYKADTVLLSGSGPTVVGVFADEKAALECCSAFQSDGKECYFAKTENTSLVFE